MELPQFLNFGIKKYQCKGNAAVRDCRGETGGSSGSKRESAKEW